LGDNLRPQEGFTYWVTMPHGHTRTFRNADVIEAGRVRKEPRHLTDFWTDHALKFIDSNRDKPFFLLLAYNGPYGLGESMLRPQPNRHAAYYAEKELNSFPRRKMHPWLAANKQLLNNTSAMRRYAAEVSTIDDGVGRILAALDKHNIDDDTLVIFTADQGLAAGQNGLWGMGDHTRPLTAFDSMTHVPLIYRHPTHIRAAQRSNILTSNYDFFPTLLDYLNVKNESSPAPRSSPGRSYNLILHGELQPWDNTVFFEFETTRAIRTNTWKYVSRFPEGPNELYNLKTDHGERHNVVDQPTHAAQQKELHHRLDAFFATYSDPRYDLTRAGNSKAPQRSR
jgi:arylsulfatase A-like enzyme